MKFMDRLSRLLGRHPDSLKTEADRPQHQSDHTATSDIEIHGAHNGSSRHAGALVVPANISLVPPPPASS